MKETRNCCELTDKELTEKLQTTNVDEVVFHVCGKPRKRYCQGCEAEYMETDCPNVRERELMESMEDNPPYLVVRSRPDFVYERDREECDDDDETRCSLFEWSYDSLDDLVNAFPYDDVNVYIYETQEDAEYALGWNAEYDGPDSMEWVFAVEVNGKPDSETSWQPGFDWHSAWREREYGYAPKENQA
jgi:hypothetical protein